ncbi:MAG: hypothetical protein IPM35_01575 [Myxococcales bacterium]|nr:hypothetical protein [Myxococcales bacterium]
MSLERVSRPAGLLFSHVLIRGAVILAFVTLLSGLALWALRAARWLGARRTGAR